MKLKLVLVSSLILIFARPCLASFEDVCRVAVAAPLGEKARGFFQKFVDDVEAEKTIAADRCRISACRSYTNERAVEFLKEYKTSSDGDEPNEKVDLAAKSNFEARWKLNSGWDQTFRERMKSRPETVTSKGASIVAAYSLADYVLVLGDFLAKKENGETFKSTTEYYAALRRELSSRHPRATSKDVEQILKVARAANLIDSQFDHSADVTIFRAANGHIARREALLNIYERVRGEVKIATHINPEAAGSILSLKTFSGSPVLRLLESGKQFDGYVETAVLTELSDISRHATALFETKMEILRTPPPPIDRLLDKAKFTASELPLKPTEIYASDYSKCRRDLLTAISDAPSVKQLATAQMMVERARAETETRIHKLYGDNGKPLVGRLSEISISLPPSKIELGDRIGNVLDLDSALSLSRLKRYKDLSTAPEFTLAEAYRLDFFEPDLATKFFNPCDEFKRTFGEMFAQTSHSSQEKANIKVSAENLSVPMETYSTVLHELGHATDPMLLNAFRNGPPILAPTAPASKIRRRVNACLAVMHGGTRPSSINGQIEDYADLIAASEGVVKRCNLLSGDNSDIRGYSVSGHSPALFRVLHSDFVYNHKLTPECEAFVKKYTKWEFRDCTNPD